MQEDAKPLVLESRITFADGRTAKLAAFEVDESWEILNIVASRGFFRWTESVKLPLTIARRWSETEIELNCGSTEAFAREVPPIAAPARPIMAETPVAISEARVLGALVSPTTRHVAEVIIRYGARRVRVPVSAISFEGKVMHVTKTPETLPEYRMDDEIATEAWRRLSHDRALAAEEKRLLDVEASGGVLTLKGNVRRKQTGLHAGALARNIPGVLRVDNEIVADLQLEMDLGWALENEGVQRTASIYARSSLGEVVLFGHASSSKVVEDAIRVAQRLPGVRSVTSRIRTGTQPEAAAA